MRAILISAALFLAVGLHPVGTVAQPTSSIRGVVRDSAGLPLSGVMVEAWATERLLASRITEDSGEFSFPGSVASQAVFLRANRLGYRHLQRRVDSSVVVYDLRLQAEPISIEGLIVESERRSCQANHEPEAEELWRAMTTRYLGPMDTVGVATYLAQAEALVERDKIGPLDLPPEESQQRGSSSQLRFSWTRRVRATGYAFPVRRTDMGASFDSWSYAPLQADFAPHFVDPVFGRLHHFRIRDQGSFGWLLEFCPVDPDRPSLRGSFRLAPDTTLVQAEWLFSTPPPDENAGGQATFPPPAGSPETSYPLPVESIFWRRLPTGKFQQVHQVYEGWIVAQGDTVPFLEPR